jgi:hypothetical protein
MIRTRPEEQRFGISLPTTREPRGSFLQNKKTHPSPKHFIVNGTGSCRQRKNKLFHFEN